MKLEILEKYGFENNTHEVFKEIIDQAKEGGDIRVEYCIDKESDLYLIFEDNTRGDRYISVTLYSRHTMKKVDQLCLELLCKALEYHIADQGLYTNALLEKRDNDELELANYDSRPEFELYGWS